MKRSVLLSILLLSFLSCAYYNTFYNARKQFHKAEEAYQADPPEIEMSNSQRELYEQAIKKASKILVFYSDSKYVDDALFLMGKSYFHMQDFGKSSRKFEELLANYPQSKYRFEAGYLLGTMHYYLEDQTKAKDALMAVIESQKKNPWADDARLILGEMTFWSEDYQGALEEYAKIPKDFPKSELRNEAMFMTGECYFKLERYPQALAAYQETRKHQFETDRRYQIELRIGECHRKLNQYAEALEIFERLARSDQYVEHLPEIRLGISEVHYLLGDTAQAIQGYENIIKQNQKTKEAAWAYYQLGLMAMEGLGDLSRAKECFDKSKSEAPVSDAAKLASLKRNQINRLEEYRQKAASADSVSLAEANFALAEVYLLDLNRPDSALAYYQKVVQRNPLSTFAPRSAYAAAWIVENSLADTASGRQMYRQLIADYPFSESANAARMHLGQPATVDTAGQDATRRLTRAEELLLREDDVDGAIAQYESIAADFPLSPYAPKAICAIAWALENIKGDRDSAMVIFKQLAEKFPDSECALLARKKTAHPSSPAVMDTTHSTIVDTTSSPPTFHKPMEEGTEGEEEGVREGEPE